MEKGNNSKVISILALIIAVAGLSIGFAAYTSTLNISASANVETVGTTDWNVGFALANGTMANLTGTPNSVAGTGVTNPGTINMYKYTISQGVAATLANSTGSSVSYAFKIKNEGSIDAALTSITTSGISCAYNSTAGNRTIEQDPENIGAVITAESGNIDQTDCETMFNVTLTIDGHDFNLKSLGTPSYTGMTIAHGSSVDATLTIAATGVAPANTILGDFIVTLGATTVVYGSTSGS